MKTELHGEKIGGSFARSPYIKDKIAVPGAMVESTFGKNFTLEDGKIVAKDANGNPIFSPSNPGEPASFDEALEILVGQSPFKDDILKGSGSGGGGAPGGGQGGAGGKTITRAEMDSLSKTSPSDAAAKMSEGYTVVD